MFNIIFQLLCHVHFTWNWFLFNLCENDNFLSFDTALFLLHMFSPIRKEMRFLPLVPFLAVMQNIPLLQLTQSFPCLINWTSSKVQELGFRISRHTMLSFKSKNVVQQNLCLAISMRLLLITHSALIILSVNQPNT